MAEIKETDHRYVGLVVNEISLVDRPANEEEWFVIKRAGGTAMDEDKTKTDETKKIVDSEQDAVTEPDAQPVSDTTPESSGAAADAPADAPAGATAGVDEIIDTEKASDPIVKALSPEQAMDLIHKMWAMLGGAMNEPVPGAAEDAKAEATAQKSLLGLSGDGELVVNQELMADIAKAKAFTASRVTAISDAIKAMMAVLHDVSPDAVKKLVESTPGAGITVAKSEPAPAQTPDVAEIIASTVTKAIASIDERIKTLEAVRGTPKSTDGDQTADITKRKSNVWEGVL